MHPKPKGGHSPHRITIERSQHQFDVEPGNTLLRAALDAGINLPYGCRNGACGACKGRVVSGKIDRGDYSDDALSEAEVAQGYALFCCARPQSDLTIVCREVDAVRDIPVKTLPCRVQRMARLAPDVMLLQLKLPASERLQFLAGQYSPPCHLKKIFRSAVCLRAMKSAVSRWRVRPSTHSISLTAII